MSQTQAVCIRNAYKHYGSKNHKIHVFKNLNMTVTESTIYGLLGPSGSGKTTLLSCIVGRKQLNSGIVHVLGGKPGSNESGIPGKRVGYMPQELALQQELTIKETLRYFGWIYGMKTFEIKERTSFLLKFLDLSNENQFVQNLSGGQQRRVSFAVALIHNPELLILDEPTVGVDPLLRESIWKHLVELTNSGHKTIIITTHYIEEARQAHKIGLLRKGYLLVEEAPDVLMKRFKLDSLEDIFLKLSRDQQASIESYLPREEQVEECIVWRETTKINWSSFIVFFFRLTTVGKFKALLQKNFLRLWRSFGLLMFNFILPIVQVSLFCLAIGGDPTNIHLAIVNTEMEWETKNCSIPETCSYVQLACRYVDQFPENTIIKDYYNTTEDAISAVKSGNAWGAIYFPEQFSDALALRVVTGKEADEEIINRSEIKAWLDMSNQQISLSLIRNLQMAYKKFIRELLVLCNKNPMIGDFPIRFEEPVYGNINPSFTNFSAPGIVLTITFFLSLALTVSALIIERTEGLLDRSWVAGVTPFEVLLSHITLQFVVMCGQIALVLIFTFVIFRTEREGSLILVVSLSLLNGIAGMCFGFLISSLCKTERSATQLALGCFYPILLVSGIIWPIEGMPLILQHISVISPLTLPTNSLRCIISRGWNLREKIVYLGFVSATIWIIIFLTLTILIFKYKNY